MTKEPSEYIDPVPDGTTWYKDVPLDLDFDKDEDADDGQNTSGIFESDGTILTIEPPGDTSYVLGPMSAMWYAWGNFTRIGYIRQEDRRMVNLASLTGELGAWDGTADAFSSYGQLTLAQADWFRTTPKKDGAGNDTPNYRAFYAGPPSNTPDEFGRYLCVITGTAKEVETAQTADTPGYTTKPVEGPEDPTTQFSALMNKLKDQAADIDWEQVGNAINVGMVALDVIAVLGILFPEPGTSIAGAARLATRMAGLKGIKQSLRNRLARGAVNPLGQRAVRSGAAGRKRVPVYSGRPYQGKRGFGKTTYGTTNPKTAATYTNPGPLKGTPGTGGKVNPKGTVDTGTLPQRYIDKYGSRSVLGQKQIKLGKKAAKRTFKNSYEMDGSLLFEDKMDSKIDMAMAVAGKLGEKELNAFFEKLLDYLDDAIENEDVTESTQTLSEERIWLREIRKPVKVPELQKKFKGIKPRVKKKGEDYRVIGGGLMKNEAVPAEFNPTRENRMWRKYEYNQNVRASQEKKNQVLELIGEGDHQWNYMLGNERWRTASQMKKFYGDHDYLYDYYYGGKKHRVIRKEGIEKDFLLFIEDENGVKDTIRQSELNDLLAEERDKEDFKEYYMHETQQKEREKNFDRATRLKTIIGKIKRGDIKPEHPEDHNTKKNNAWQTKIGKH